MTITEFLTARLDEDEAVAREVQDKVRSGRYYEDPDGSTPTACFDRYYNQGGVTFTSARVLADVAAKRAIVELARSVEHESDTFGDDTSEYRVGFHDGRREVAEAMLRHLALPYADHPDWREEWRP